MEDILELIWFRESRERPMDFLSIREIPDEEGRRNVRISEQVSDLFRQMDEDEKADALDGIRSILDDPLTVDVLSIGGVRGSYRVVQLGQDQTAN